MRGIEILLQDFAVKMQGGGGLRVRGGRGYSRDTMVVSSYTSRIPCDIRISKNHSRVCFVQLTFDL